MKYASEVIELMGAYPGREFRMREIVRYATKGRAMGEQERKATRLAIWRAVCAFIDNGSILTREEKAKRGAPVFYRWKSAT